MSRSLLITVLYPADRALSLIALAGVLGYRRIVSPRKGFRCAYAACTGEPSCSDMAKDAFGRLAFSKAAPLVRRRVSQCDQTYRLYTSNLIDDAQAHLAKLAPLAAVGVLGGCGCETNKKPTPPPPMAGIEPQGGVASPPPPATDAPA